MKVHCLIVGFLGLVLSAHAQFGNEWVNPDQHYFKIPVGKEGLYRLPYTQVTNAGVPAGVNPASFQIFYRGQEISLYVDGQSDGQFNTTDFIEFFGKPNDGSLDTELYTSTAAQPHPYYSLFTDTAYYYLTYGQATGKRMALATTANPGSSAEAFHFEQSLNIYKTDYSGGKDYGEIQLSTFEEGEGWLGPQIIQGQTGSYVIDGIALTAPAAGVPSLEVNFVGRGNMQHHVELYAGGRLLSAVNFEGYNAVTYNGALQWSDVSNDGKITINVKVIGSNNQSDRVSVGYIKLRYPQQVDMANASSKKLTLNTNVNGTSVVEVKNAPSGTRVYDVTDFRNVRRITTSLTTTLNAVVSGTSSEKVLWLSATQLSTSLKRVSFRNFENGANYVVITHPDLRKPAGGYIDPVKALAEYRSLPEGGSYDTLVANITQLYDQFTYGNPSPAAITHFLKYLSATKRPSYLLLVGKGLDIYYNYYRNPSTYTQFKNYVPSAGYPASDMLFSAGIGGESNVPAISTGRLSAAGPLDVVAYFNKLKEFEARPFDDLRKKNLLHLSGGLYPGEPEYFKGILKSYANTAEDVYLGGKVKAIAKQSTDIEVVNVAEEVNNGVALITLFGHSSPTSADFDIGLVTDPVMGYNNKGKYTALLLNGCSAGSFFLNSSIFGENWTNTADRGAIAVIAHSYFGFAPLLQQYSGLFYKIQFGNSESINNGIGDVQRQLASQYLNNFGSDPAMISQIQEMVLLGDPALRLFAATKPDYAIVSESVTLETKSGEALNAFSDSLVLKFIVQNFGKVAAKDFKVRVTRTLNGGNVVQYDSTFSKILYSDTIRFQLPGNITEGFGNNMFSIEVDALDEVEELRESNNNYAKQFFIPLSGTKNLYPNDFAIVKERQLNLTFQHTDHLSTERTFLLEVDTSFYFNSPFKKSFEVTAKVLALKSLELLDEDSTVYYWRTKLAVPSANESQEWQTSSFTYINNGEDGWAQVAFEQFDKNAVSGLVKDFPLKRVEFIETKTDLAIKTFKATETENISVKIANAEYNLLESSNFVCRNNTINLIAFDKKTTQPYLGIFFTWIEIQNVFQGRRLYCGREPYVINSFAIDELTMGSNADLIQYVDNIAVGDSVVLFNIGDAGFSTWPVAAKNKLSELGISISQFNQLQSGDAVIIRGRKGASPGSAEIIKSAVAQPQAEFSGTVTGRNASGTMRSGLIGPSSAWRKLTVNYIEENTTDVVVLNIYGVDMQGAHTLLFENITDDMDLSGVDASQYPYLQLYFASTDETFVTSAQLQKWIVTFEPTAEGILLVSDNVDDASVAEGDQFKKQYTFVNISNKTFADSLHVNYELVNTSTFKTTQAQMKIEAPQPGDSTVFIVPFNTVGQRGVNNVDVFVNERILPENTFDNNFINLPSNLTVLGDSIAPVLSVTVDGRTIAREEVVSSNPLIDIKLWDNNPFMMKRDTAGMIVLLRRPCDDIDCDPERIFLSSPEIVWTPESATSPFNIVYRPSLPTPGVYTLRVEGKDASGNASGSEPYETSFTISAVSSVIFTTPFPNPFDREVHFSFVITGSGETLPSNATLDIVNISGRQIHQFVVPAETLHVGNNTLNWNGIDQHGTPLPNGIYIYRFNIDYDGKQITSVGKIVLVR